VVGVRGFVICFEIGRGHGFCFEMFVWVERFCEGILSLSWKWELEK